MSTRRALRRSIEGFERRARGPAAAAVAETLTQLGVRGCPKDSTQCALARYLWVIVGSERSVVNIAVTDRSVHVRRSPGRLPLIIGLPRPVRTFIRAFDSGATRSSWPSMGPTSDYRTWFVATPERSRQKN